MMNKLIDQTIQDAIDKNRIVGAAVLVSKNGEVVYETAKGFFDRELNRPMQMDTLFRLASVTKLYIAVATMVSISKGNLSLEDVVDQFLPYFTPRLADGSAPKITIRQLLTHTSGLAYGMLEEEDGPLHRAHVSDGMDITTLSLEENLRRLATVPLRFNPGTSWMYSLAFDVLGGILEQVEHNTLDEVVRQLVTQPLGLTQTGFSLTDLSRLAPAYMNALPIPVKMKPERQQITGYEGLAPVVVAPNRAYQANAFPSGGAGMVGSPKDLLTILELLRKGGEGFLSSSLIQEMSQNQIQELPVAGWPGWGHGLGFSVLVNPLESNTPESIGTWHWGGTYGHSWLVDPTRELTLVAFTNTALEGMLGGGRFPTEIRDAVYRSF